MITQELAEISMSPQEFLIKYAISQSEMANLLGVSRRVVEYWITGQRIPSATAKRALAMADILMQNMKTK